MASVTNPDKEAVTKEVDCTFDDLLEGKMKQVGFGEGKILLSKIDGKIYATSAICTHYGAPLAKGVLTSTGRVVCPWHGACFSVKTGDIEDAPGLDALHAYTVIPSSNTSEKIKIQADLKIVESKKGKNPCDERKGVARKTKKNERVVIVGGGSGGAGAIEGLRELGFRGKITVISKEPHGPIDRTKLSKALTTDASKIALRPASEYESPPYSIELITSTEVTALDLKGDKIIYGDGKEMVYDHLVMATGADPNRLPLDGIDLKNVFQLRGIEDSKKIDAALKEGSKLVLVGSSFISMELAVVASKRKLASLDVVGMESVPFENVLGKEVGKGFKTYHEKQGVTFHMEAEIDSFVSKDGTDKVGGVKLKNGKTFEADLVVLGVGAKPNTSLLKDAGIEIEKDNSVKVDGFLRVQGLKNVYAVGDIATYPYRGGMTRIEHWNVAANHGRAAAESIAGDPANKKPFSKIPIFWSAQGAQLRYCGNSKGFDDVYVNGDAAELNFAAYYAKGEDIIAVASMAQDPLNSHCSELLRLEKMPSMSEVKGGKNPLDIALTA
ncbi:flavo protein [Phaffia rhodozyma]|uniref:Flavo protein n=1 Tax=Phaffia rhodozyma TaxID=264483 RepID=A0A0F7STA1_PHARH|nr:flavo protein [Phaffia rhodozyma]